MKYWIAPLSLLLAIAGCASQPRTFDLPEMAAPEMQVEESDFGPMNAVGAATVPGGLAAFADADARLSALAERIYRDPASVPYAEFWAAYLDSSKIHTAVVDRNHFKAFLDQLPAESERCGAVDWQRWTAQNFFELEPHLVAQDCYEQLGKTQQADRESRAVQYILRGVLGSGDGEKTDTAYEIGILDHANDILNLAGYHILDSFLLPVRDGMGLYYVVLAEDPQSGIQRSIYFDNQPAIHRLLAVDYPFAGLDDLYLTQLLEPMSENNTAAMVGLGYYQELSGKRKKAISFYMDAAAYGSQVAQYRLGRLCLVSEDLAMFSRGDCVDFLLSAAEKGHAEAMSLLAYIYREGIGVEASEQLAAQFLQAAQQRTEAGLAELQFSSYYAGDRLVVDAEVELAHLRKAAATGLPDAKYALLRREVGDWWEADAEKLLPGLQELAEQGYAPAAVAYARWIFTHADEHTEKERHRAREFLDAALAVNSDSAHMLQGSLLQSGLLGERDFEAAAGHFMQSPFYTASQIGMARLHNEQRLPQSGPVGAALWYMMCAKVEVPECMYQLGKLFRNGEGVDRDRSIAMTLFAGAARQGHKMAMAEVEKMEQQ